MGIGQITDDSEMGMCILHGLADHECSISPSESPSVLNLDGITHYFGKWAIHAFDIGYTTRRALNPIHNFDLKKHHFTPAVFKQVERHNKQSESNGCLMRITP